MLKRKTELMGQMGISEEEEAPANRTKRKTAGK
jgi:hypothetical protein